MNNYSFQQRAPEDTRRLHALLADGGIKITSNGRSFERPDGTSMTLPEQIGALETIILKFDKSPASSAVTTQRESADLSGVLAAKDGQIAQLKESEQRAWSAVVAANTARDAARAEVASRDAIIKAKDVTIESLKEANMSEVDRVAAQRKRLGEALEAVATINREKLKKLGVTGPL